jgi:hypothetical protein
VGRGHGARQVESRADLPLKGLGLVTPEELCAVAPLTPLFFHAARGQAWRAHDRFRSPAPGETGRTRAISMPLGGGALASSMCAAPIGRGRQAGTHPIGTTGLKRRSVKRFPRCGLSRQLSKISYGSTQHQLNGPQGPPSKYRRSGSSG